MHASARFTNPLPIPLKNGKFLIDGPGMKEQVKIRLTESVAVNGIAECSFSMEPRREGRATIAAKFYSKELEDVEGFINFMVEPAEINNIVY